MEGKYKLLIAWRYFFSRKQKSVINAISWISLAGLAVSTLALIVVLSVYNGIGNLTQTLFNAFDPQLLVSPTQGKSFHTHPKQLLELSSIDGVEAVSQIAEENAWVTYNQNQAIVQLRGVDENYPKITGIDTLLYEGAYLLQPNFLVIGAEIWYQLGLRSTSNVPIAVHIPHRTGGIGFTMEEAFNTGYAYPAGNFYIQQDIDSRYIVADIDFVRQLLDYTPDECSSLAISLASHASVKRVKQQVADLLNTDGMVFSVKDRFEQQPLYYKVFRSERLGIILILSLIVLISTFSLIASLSLLIIDKRKDVATLRSIGMEARDVRQIFFLEGEMIVAIGAIVGLMFGFVVCWLQQQYGIVRMGDGGFVTQAFPVAMRLADFVGTWLLVMAIGTISVALTIRRSKSL